MNVVAVLPARNEAARIGRVIAQIKHAHVISKIIVVDDASTDETSTVAMRTGAHVVRLRKHGGVGVATRTGLKAAMRYKPTAVVFLDADGQHDPRYIPSFIAKIKSGAEFAVGHRDLSHYPRMKRFGNFMLHSLAELLAPTGIKDPECGFRIITADAARRLDLRANSYDICMDFVYNVWKNNFRVAQIDIKVPVYYPKKGTKIRTGLANFWWLFRQRVLG